LIYFETVRHLALKQTFSATSVLEAFLAKLQLLKIFKSGMFLDYLIRYCAHA